MNNFFLGLEAVLGEAKGTLSQVAAYPLFWGFATGFITSTVVHAFLMVDHPRQVGDILFRDKAQSFEKMYPSKPDGSYAKSYTEFSRMVDRTKITFLSAFLLATVVLLAVSLTR